VPGNKENADVQKWRDNDLAIDAIGDWGGVHSRKPPLQVGNPMTRPQAPLPLLKQIEMSLFHGTEVLLGDG